MQAIISIYLLNLCFYFSLTCLEMPVENGFHKNKTKCFDALTALQNYAVSLEIKRMHIAMHIKKNQMQI